MAEAIVEGPKTGTKMCLYYSTSLDNLDGVNVLISEVQNVNVSDFSRKMVEIQTRQSEWTSVIPGVMEVLGTEFNLLHDMNRELEDALMDIFLNAEQIMIKVMNGPIDSSGARGIAYPAYIVQAPWNQQLNEVSERQFKVQLAWNKTVQPELIKVA